MTHLKAAVHAPVRCNGSERFENEISVLELLMRDGEASRAEPSAAPHRDVEIEDPRAPALPTPPAEVALDCLQLLQHFRRLQAAFDKRNRVGEFAARWPHGFAEDDRRGIEKLEFLVQSGDRRFDDLRRAAVTAMSAVRTDGDGVELGHATALSLRAVRGNPGARLDCFVTPFLAMTSCASTR